MNTVRLAEGIAAAMWPSFVFALAAVALTAAIVWWQRRREDPEQTPPWVTAYFTGLGAVILVATLIGEIRRHRGRHRRTRMSPDVTYQAVERT
jgi:uncharacterized iron-regulated membrane protein